MNLQVKQQISVQSIFCSTIKMTILKATTYAFRYKDRRAKCRRDEGSRGLTDLNKKLTTKYKQKVNADSAT